MASLETFSHSIQPVYDEHARILILGSFPSVRSRAQEFFYAHPRNRFWELLSRLLQKPKPQTTEQKITFLQQHKIALYDVIERCDIHKSSDASIQNAVPADLTSILQTASIRHVFLNGGLAGKLYRQFQAPAVDLPYTILPSTSPANASYSLEKLEASWQIVTRTLYEK